MLATVLARSQHPFAEVVVDSWIGAACARAGEGERAGPQPVPPDQELGARGDEGRIATAHGEHEATRKRASENVEDGGDIVRTRGVDLYLARKNDLLDAPGCDQLNGAGDSRLVVLGSERATDPVAFGRVRVK